MDKEEKLTKRWKFLHLTIKKLIMRKFNLQVEECRGKGPVIVICNHSCNWDPLLLATAFPERTVHFVASEHIFRLGLISKFISFMVDPIPMPKGEMGAGAALGTLRKLREGCIVGLFAEGEATWNGENNPIPASTGKLVRSSGAALVTYRLEGAYLSRPRWALSCRKGKTRGRVVGVYTPDELKAMTPQSINQLIQRDITESCWERQKAEPVKFYGKNLAEGIEQAIYVCPQCGGLGTVQGTGDYITCSCGMNIKFTKYGTFEPSEPFENLAQWDSWQQKAIAKMDFGHKAIWFSDDEISLRELIGQHDQKLLCCGSLVQKDGELSCGGTSFNMADISGMAMVKANILLLTIGKSYYELRSENLCCLRKYLEVWRNYKKGGE